MGRPSKYNPDYHVPWAKSLAMEGLTDQQIANSMEVSRSTLSKWKKDHKEFEKALLMGKEPADANVELSLYKRAIGFSYKEKKIIQNIDADGNTKPARVEIIERHAIPDVTAQIFWLKNRKPNKYKDKQQQEVEVDKEMTIKIIPASEVTMDD